MARLPTTAWPVAWLRTMACLPVAWLPVAWLHTVAAPAPAA
ncbi:hypothetical protein ACLQ22_05890 [Micromonospora sp. DT178]